ncbi:MAG: hypothetical protein DHS80DRAFT_30101 [Piptocephalis tieghemiana]|nr:MAG: hypothetical protein DHS80DRAFT_30101 [Piptocephalis tieghemiana]
MSIWSALRRGTPRATTLTTIASPLPSRGSGFPLTSSSSSTWSFPLAGLSGPTLFSLLVPRLQRVEAFSSSSYSSSSTPTSSSSHAHPYPSSSPSKELQALHCLYLMRHLVKREQERRNTGDHCPPSPLPTQEARALLTRLLSLDPRKTQVRRAYAHLLDTLLVPHVPISPRRPLPMRTFAEIMEVSNEILSTIKPSARIMNRILWAYAATENPDYHGARQTFFTYLKAGVNPDRWSYGHLGTAAARRGMVEEVKTLIREREWMGIQVDAQAYGCLVHAFSRKRHARGMMRAVHLCQAKGIILSTPIWLELARGLARCDQLTAAVETMERLGKQVGFKVWAYLLAQSRSHGHTNLEARILRGMVQHGWNPPKFHEPSPVKSS